MENNENDSERSSREAEADAKFPVTREMLYAKVWSEPMTALAREYGVSSSYLARVCSRLNVPRPERGYWAKLAAGKTVKRQALPEAQPDTELEWSKGGEFRGERRLPEPPENVQRKIASSKTSRAIHHRLIRGAKELFLLGKETDNGYLKPNKLLLVDILVSKFALDAALNVVNQLFTIFEDNGYRVNISPNHEYFCRHKVDERDKPGKHQSHINQWSPLRPTVVYVGTVAIGLTLFEISEEVEVMWVNGEYIPISDIKSKKHNRHTSLRSWTTTRDRPSGRFRLQAYSPYAGTSWMKQWEIVPGEALRALGNQIAEELMQHATIISGLVKEAVRQAELERQRWEEMQKEWRREEENRRREKALKQSSEELLRIIESWAETKRVEGFFKEMEGAAVNMSPEVRGQFKSKLECAKELVLKGNALESLLDWKMPDER